MTVALAPTVCASVSDLHAQARSNLAKNMAALGRTVELPAIDFTLGRDGSLTAKRDGAWIGGCSVPRRAAELMLRTLAVRGNLACVAAPTHAHQVVVCQERMEPSAGLIALLNDAHVLAEMLACVDFSNAIGAGRLFFVVGIDELRDLFDRHPGLPVPQQFVRIAAASGEIADVLQHGAQVVFNDIAKAQHDRLVRVHREERPCGPAAKRGAGSVVVLAPSAFRLWNDAGYALGSLVDGTLIDPDDPRVSAVAHIAEVVSEHDALLSVDIARADRGELARTDQPWMTWITQPRVPAFVKTSPRDGVVLCDESLRAAATRAGWPANRIVVAPVPSPLGERVRVRGEQSATTPQSSAGTIPPHPNPLPQGRGDQIALIMDLPDLAPPASVKDFSSWRLVWEAIERDLTNNPTKLGNDASAYLDRMLAKQNVADRNLPKALFIDSLIAPAYAIGIARLLAREDIPLALHGRGWDRIAALTDFARGPVLTRDVFIDALSDSAAVVDVFVTHAVHPVRTSGRPTIRTSGATAQRIVQDARTALSAPPAETALSADGLRIAVGQLLH